MTRSRAAALVAVALVAVAAVALLSGGDGRTVQAEFTSARGLLVGNEVRVRGAPAGSVSEIELTGRGTALVTIELDAAVEPIMADATAAIRPVDLLGDIYLSLDPGRSGQLDGPIPASQTSNSPRLTELVSVFREPQRAGLQAVLVELGRALEARGVDVNRATVELRPALEATDDLMSEVDSQNTDLRGLVSDAERATDQLARRQRDVRLMVDGLAGTLRATAASAPDLDAGLERAPATLDRLSATAPRLQRAARELRPLSASLGEAAPGLATAAARLEPFLARAEPAAESLRPTVRRLTDVLLAGDPTLPELRRGLDELGAATPDLRPAAALAERAAPGIAEGFFVNFPDQAAELGKGTYPDAAGRHYWRGAGVVSCEAFGVPVAPGCLFDALGQFLTPSAARRLFGLADAGGGSERASRPRGDGRETATAGAPAPQPSAGDAPPSAGDAPAPPQPPAAGPAPPPAAPGSEPSAPTQPPDQGALGDLLDFLFGP